MRLGYRRVGLYQKRRYKRRRRRYARQVAQSIVPRLPTLNYLDTARIKLGTLVDTVWRPTVTFTATPAGAGWYGALDAKFRVFGYEFYPHMINPGGDNGAGVQPHTGAAPTVATYANSLGLGGDTLATSQPLTAVICMKGSMQLGADGKTAGDTSDDNVLCANPSTAAANFTVRHFGYDAFMGDGASPRSLGFLANFGRYKYIGTKIKWTVVPMIGGVQAAAVNYDLVCLDGVAHTTHPGSSQLEQTHFPNGVSPTQRPGYVSIQGMIGALPRTGAESAGTRMRDLAATGHTWRLREVKFNRPHSDGSIYTKSVVSGKRYFPAPQPVKIGESNKCGSATDPATNLYGVVAPTCFRDDLYGFYLAPDVDGLSAAPQISAGTAGHGWQFAVQIKIVHYVLLHESNRTVTIW